MSSLHELILGSKLLRQLGVVVCTASLFACSTPGTTRPVAVATQDESGFTITEKVNVSSSVRSKFKNAMRVLGEKEYERGIALLSDATEAAPNVTSLHIDLGIAYSQIGDHERAEESIKKALQLNPLHPVAHNELGIIYRKTGRFERARKSYESALEVHPEFHFARRNLAILCDVYLGDLSCALENYQAYSQMVTDDEAVDMWISDLRARIGE